MRLQLIAEDLERHAWYTELESRLVADVEAFAARWAAFEALAAASGQNVPDANDEPAG